LLLLNLKFQELYIVYLLHLDLTVKQLNKNIELHIDFPFTGFQNVIEPSAVPTTISDLLGIHVIDLIFYLPCSEATCFIYFSLPGLSKSNTPN
jgi:hypothetical protein